MGSEVGRAMAVASLVLAVKRTEERDEGAGSGWLVAGPKLAQFGQALSLPPFFCFLLLIFKTFLVLSF